MCNNIHIKRSYFKHAERYDSSLANFISTRISKPVMTKARANSTITVTNIGGYSLTKVIGDENDVEIIVQQVFLKSYHNCYCLVVVVLNIFIIFSFP